MSASLSTEGRGLKAFRLSDVPLDLRVRAARVLMRRADEALPPEAAGTTGLLATLISNRSARGHTGDHEVIRRVAENPSDKVYWIPRDAWDKVIG